MRVRRSARAAALPGWVLFLVAGLLLIGAYYLLPSAGVTQAVIICLVNAASAVAAFTAVRGDRGLSRYIWMGLALGVSFSTLANIPNYGYPLITGRVVPFPSLVDLPWLLMYPCFLVALAALATMSRGRDRRGDVLDALIVIVGGCTVLWVFMFEPIVRSTPLHSLAFFVSILFPTMDVVVFAMLVRLLMGSRNTVSTTFLSVSFVSLLLGDLTYSVALFQGSYRYGGPSDALWMLSYLLVGVAALHPSARSFPQASTTKDHRLYGGRMVFLGAALLSGPVLLATLPDHSTILLVSSVASFLLVMARLGWLNRRLVEAGSAVAEKSEELRHQALHDVLTGLPNRGMVMALIEGVLARNRHEGTDSAVLYLDLDGFKKINDTLGHDVGDRLLQEAAVRMASVVRPSDTVARLGGDEFVVLLGCASEQGDAELIAERLLHVMREPFVIDRVLVPLVVTASIGVARGTPESGADLLRDADLALYRAKADGRNCFRVFTGDMGLEEQHRYELDFDLRAALDGDQFRLTYEAIHQSDDARVQAFTAVIRWDHPQLGWIGAQDFVHRLEASGQIIDVGRWMLHSACGQMAAWRAVGMAVHVSVPVSVRQLDRADVVTEVRDALDAHRLDPGALILEVKESALVNGSEGTVRALHDLKALGVQIAVADFGSCLASLAYVQRYPVDAVKIERVPTDPTSGRPSATSDVLVCAVSHVSESFGLRTLVGDAAAGVPLDADDVLALLARRELGGSRRAEDLSHPHP